MLVICQTFDLLSYMQAVFLGQLVTSCLMLQFPHVNSYFSKMINISFLRHHKFNHAHASAYLTQHFEHHDVVPLASIGAAGGGFQEVLFRGLGLVHFNNQWLLGYNLFRQYVATSYDEWAHNYCPTASRSGIIAVRDIHVEHHFDRTLPLGFRYDDEMAVGWRGYDERFWENIKRFAPGLEFHRPSTFQEYLSAYLNGE